MGGAWSVGGQARARVSPHGVRSTPTRPRSGGTGRVGGAGPAATATATTDVPRRRTATYWLAYTACLTIGFNELRAAGWAISDWLFMVAAVAGALALLAGHHRAVAPVAVRRTPPVLLVSSTLLLTAGTLSSMWSPDPFGSAMVVVRFAWLTIIWFWLMRAVSVDGPALGKLIAGYKVSVLISAAAALLGSLGVPIHPPNWGERQAAFWGHPNSLAIFLVIGLPFFLLDVPRKPARPRGRPVWQRLCLAGFVLVAVGTTGSMTGFAAALVAVVTMGGAFLVTGSMRQMRLNPLTAITVMVIVGVAATLFLRSDSAVVDRFMRWQSGDQYVSGSVSSRDAQRDIVLEQIDERLVIGVGFVNETLSQDENIVTETAGGVHNMYLKLIYEAGFPAFAALVILVAATVDRGFRLVRYTRGTPLHPMAVALLATLAAVNAHAFFQPVLFRRTYWFPVALIWSLYALCRYEARRHEELGSGAQGAPWGVRGTGSVPSEPRLGVVEGT